MIYQKISEIMQDLVEIGKIKREDIVPTMLPLLAKKNLVIRPIEIDDYKFFENNSSFIATYELIDTEDYTKNKDSKKNDQEQINYQSVIVKLPAGGCDGEGKGRATYMASTGVYRQILQQVFSIAILEPDEENINNQTGNSNNENQESNKEKEMSETFDEFEADNETSAQEENPPKTVDEMTDDDIDKKFENF